MQTGRPLQRNRLALVLLCGVLGCGASVGRDVDPANARAGSIESSVHPTGESNGIDGLYGADPLVPPIRFDGDGPADAKPAVVSPVFQLFSGGILAADFTADERAAFHPHGSQVCGSGCAASNHATPELSHAAFHHLLADYRRGPLDETNHPLETLLFYGRQSAALLDSSATASLDAQHAAFLRRELNKTHALLSFRVVDEAGVVRVEMRRTRVPLDRRHVFDMDSRDLPPLVSSGTVKRVGLYHLWTRL